jgi:hypothetical protein
MKRALLITLAVLWTCGCGGESRKDIVAVQHTVLRYTQLLAEGYAQMNMTPLQAVATEEQSLKAYNHMSALGEGKIRMESHLEDIEFLDIHLPEKDLARVKTREKWNYAHINIANHGKALPSQKVVQGLIYNLDYELVKRDGRWFVSSVSVLEEDKAGHPATTDNGGSKGADLETKGANAT